MSYDPDRTQQEIHRHTGGNSLDPMSMLYDGQTECFKLIGKNKNEIAEIKETDADQGARLAAAEEQLKTLQTRLWGLLAGVILAVAGAASTWLFS